MTSEAVTVADAHAAVMVDKNATPLLRHSTPLPKLSLRTKKYCSSITMAFIIIRSHPQSYCFLNILIVVFINYLAVLHSLTGSPSAMF